MRRFRLLLFCGLVLLCGRAAWATIFGNVRGIVHDPSHRPIAGAQVVLHARTSDWSQTAETNDNGEFQFAAVPVGEYTVTVSHAGFDALEESLTVTSGSAPILHVPLKLATVQERVTVTAAPEQINPESSATHSLVSREQIARTPGADRTDSLSMITDYVPGAYVVHDQLHIRGGHQVSWLIDGVPVPNTNIASNVGAQFDPKDIDYIEVQRGGLSAEYGDRTYGVFNVATRTGFEGNRQGEFIASFGTQDQTNDYLSLGSHTQRFAYYASLNGNRTNLGLETPTSRVLHDSANGFGGFTSLIFNATPNDQLRLVTSLRRDHFQVPNTPDQESGGIRDVEDESDALVNFSWVHTFGLKTLLTVAPFYHFNRAHYIGGPRDTISPEDDRGSQYAGGEVTLASTLGKNNGRIGLMSFEQRDNTLFGITTTDASIPPFHQREILWGSVSALFLEDEYKLFSWLSLNGGIRYTHYSGSLVENVPSPRAGAAIRIPRLGWVLRGSYSRYYQAPPLNTISGPLLELCQQQGCNFLPLRGERDEQWEAGLAIPIRGWTLDFDRFHTWAHNFFDHDVIGNSNIFFPLTLELARIQGWESTVRSPQLFHRARIHLAYSNQQAQWSGMVTGGLNTSTLCAPAFCYLDHDQRNTLSTGFQLEFPWQSWLSGNVVYGSGFLDGNGPGHLPGHTAVDLSLGKEFGEDWSARITALNIGNRRYLLDDSNTFGGTHFANPREITVQLRYRFHF